MTNYVNCKSSEGSGNYRKLLKSEQKNILLILWVSLEIIKAPESAFMFLIYPLKQRRITTKNTGTKKIASNVAETIPPITPIPTAFCAPLPAPLLIASGNTPRIKARGHQDRTQTHTYCHQCRFNNTFTLFLHEIFSELNDQNSVFGRQANCR